MLRPPKSLGLGNKRRKLIEVIINYPIRGKARLRLCKVITKYPRIRQESNT